MMLKSFGQYSGEIFILILFAASWLLLRVEGKGLAELGFDAPVRRVGELVAGFFIAGALIALMRLGSAWRSDVTWEWNSSFIPLDYLKYLVWPKVTAVLLIALVCQGYLLLLAMRLSGRTSGLWLSAIAFCVCNLAMMWDWGHRLDNLSVLAPASWYLVYGFVLALAFRQTGSMAAPIGLNLGWFVVGGTVFGDFVPSFEPLVLSEGESLKEDVVSVVISFGLMIAALVSAIWLLYRPALMKGKGFRGKQAIRPQG
jgi:hypothetical protein